MAKKIFITMLLFIVLVMPCYVLCVSEVKAETAINIEKFYGDADGDGRVTTEDYDCMDKIISGTVLLTTNLKERMDLDGNGVIDSNDRNYLNQYLEKTITYFPVEKYWFGDLNLDQTVDIGDVVLLDRYIQGIENMNAETKVRANVNGDGSIDDNDTILIRSYIQELIYYFPISNQLDYIQIKSKLSKLEYLIGENLSTEGLVIEAFYKNGYHRVVNSYGINGSVGNAIGTNQIVIDYSEAGISRTVSYGITVKSLDEFISVSSSHVYAYNGDTALFSVFVAGGNLSSYSYQWYYASSLHGFKTPISGATSSKYNVMATSAMNGYYYFCRVRNGNISTFSSGMCLNLLYKVCFNANGGTGVPSVQTKYHGITLGLSSTTPTRTGYEFQGWSTSTAGTTVSYLPGNAYSKDDDVTLYAVWEKIKEQNVYTIIYDANGGFGEPNMQTKLENESIILSGEEPVREGYKFLGWSISKTATLAGYLPGSSYMGNEDITLYAVWERVEEPDITTPPASDEPTPTPGITPTSIPDNKPTAMPTLKPSVPPENTQMEPPEDNDTESPEKSPQNIQVKDNLILAKGEKKNVNALAEGALSYRCSNQKVASVSAGGMVKAKGYGQAVITVYARETSWFRTATKRIKVTVASRGTRIKSAKSRKKGKLTLSWKKSKDATKYQVCCSPNRDFLPGTYHGKIFSKPKTVTITGLKSGKAYYIRIRTYRKVGGNRFYSAWSNIKKVRIK